MVDLWDEVVGIDIDEWMRADSDEQIRWLAHLRDHPMPQQGPRPYEAFTFESEDWFDVLDGNDNVIKRYRA